MNFLSIYETYFLTTSYLIVPNVRFKCLHSTNEHVVRHEGVYETTISTPRKTSIKNQFIFYLRISRYSKVIYFVYHCQNYHELNFTFSRQRTIWSFHVVVLQKTAKKCTKNYEERAEPLFSDVPFAVAVDPQKRFTVSWCTNINWSHLT